VHLDLTKLKLGLQVWTRSEEVSRLEFGKTELAPEVADEEKRVGKQKVIKNV
jgi:hypothetical protein